MAPSGHEAAALRTSATWSAGSFPVTEVIADTPAQRAGMQVHDVITAINGKKIANGGDLLDTIANAFVPIHRDGYKFVGIAAIAASIALKSISPADSFSTTPLAPS